MKMLPRSLRLLDHNWLGNWITVHFSGGTEGPHTHTHRSELQEEQCSRISEICFYAQLYKETRQWKAIGYLLLPIVNHANWWRRRKNFARPQQHPLPLQHIFLFAFVVPDRATIPHSALSFFSFTPPHQEVKGYSTSLEIRTCWCSINPLEA